MAFRWMYRKKNTLFICLCASSFWFIYLFLSLPSNKETKIASSTAIKNSEKKNSPTSPSRQYFDVKKVDPHQSVIEAPKRETSAPKTEAPKWVNVPQKVEGLEVPGKEVKPSVAVVKPEIKSGLLNISVTKVKPTNNSHPLKTKKKEGNLVLELGEKLRNKTVEVGQKMKNKTLEKLTELGVIKSPPKINNVIYAALSWPLNLSLTDINEVMKETNHLSKQQNLSVNYPKLLPMKTNFTEGNTTIALRKVVMANRVGFCDCEDYDCMCCARVTHARIHVNATACANITFKTKSQEFDFNFSMDYKLIYKSVIPAENAPKICLGSVTKVADLCIRFLNLTSSVKAEEEHKFRVVGCMEYSISLFNKTVSAFPVDCFEIPSHQHHQKEHKESFQLVGNWMP